MSRMMHMFRKYQYILLIVVGVLLMFVFVVGDALDQLASTGAGAHPDDEIVLTWKRGDLTSSDLYGMRVKHNIAVEFLSEVVQETIRREGTPKGPGVYRDQFGRYSPGISVAQSDEDLIQKMLLAAQAESLGVVVDNETVKAFLFQLSDGELLENDLGVIYNKSVAGRLTQQHLMDQLQHELLAQQMLMMTRAGLFVVPPREAWELHSRLRRRVLTEMVALPVERFMDQVTRTPSDAQIAALFAEAKDRFPDPYSPLPGFKRRRKVAFEYVRADFGKIQDEEIAKVKDSITDAEIEAHYEKNKDRYRDFGLPAGELSDDSPAPASEEAAPSDSPPASDSSDKTEPAAEPAQPAAEAPAESTPDPPAAEKPPTPAPAEQPATEKAADPSAEKPEGQEDASPAANDGDANESDNCLTQADNETPASESPENEADAPPEPTAPPQPNANAPAASESEPATPADNPPAATDPATPAAPTEEPAPATEPAAPPAAATSEQPADPETPATPAENPPAAQPEEPKFRPLDDKLREEIRLEIARDRSRQPAQERLDKALNEIKAAVEGHGRQLRRFDTKEKADSPASLDFETLAAERGFTAGKLDPVDALGVSEFELGRSFEMTFTSWPPQRVPFSQIAFAEGLQDFRPQRIKSAESDVEFLYWRTGEEAAFVPKFEDIRDEVIDVWKRQEAFVLAKAEAERMVKTAGGDKPLAESLGELAGLEVIEPTPFSWMTTGMTPFGGAGAPTLSQVEGVEAAGNDFMKSVFSLRQGEVGIAIDQPQRTVYLVRVVFETPPQDNLREQFLTTGITPEMSQIAFSDIEDVWQGWYQDLEREMKVVWKTPNRQ